MLKYIQTVWQSAQGRRSPQPSPSSLDWILPRQLAVGPIPSTCDLLQQAGIQAVVSLCAPSEGALPAELPQQFDHARFILPDSSYLFDLDPRQLRQIAQHIHTHIQQGRAVYVHCLAGVERSPTVCASYLCLYRGLALWEATAVIAQHHPIARLTERQLRAIRSLCPQPAISS
jgi:predicted protein tyrosine phosphatase